MFGPHHVYRGDRAPFGEHWCGPEKLTHGEDTLVAVYEPTQEDGQRVEVYATAWPALFFRLRVGTHLLSTGSGACALAAEMAQAIAGGRLNVGQYTKPTSPLLNTANPPTRELLKAHARLLHCAVDHETYEYAGHRWHCSWQNPAGSAPGTWVISPAPSAALWRPLDRQRPVPPYKTAFLEGLAARRHNMARDNGDLGCETVLASSSLGHGWRQELRTDASQSREATFVRLVLVTPDGDVVETEHHWASNDWAHARRFTAFLGVVQAVMAGIVPLDEVG